MKVEPDKVHRLFYPQVPLVLCAGFGARVSAMPVVSYASISSKPPLVGVACSPLAFTFKLALKSHAFSLCLLEMGKAGALERLATLSGAKLQDKLGEAGLSHSPGRVTQAPIIDGAQATIECSLRSRTRLGDHVWMVGQVEACSASKAFGDFWDYDLYRPILYTGWRGGLTTYAKRARGLRG